MLPTRDVTDPMCQHGGCAHSHVGLTEVRQQTRASTITLVSLSDLPGLPYKRHFLCGWCQRARVRNPIVGTGTMMARATRACTLAHPFSGRSPPCSTFVERRRGRGRGEWRTRVSPGHLTLRYPTAYVPFRTWRARCGSVTGDGLVVSRVSGGWGFGEGPSPRGFLQRFPRTKSQRPHSLRCALVGRLIHTTTVANVDKP